jgi:hypothetical protein
MLIFGHYYLDTANFGNLQDLEEQDFEQQQAVEQGKCSLTILILYSFCLYFTQLYASKLNPVSIYPSLSFHVDIVMR